MESPPYTQRIIAEYHLHRALETRPERINLTIDNGADRVSAGHEAESMLARLRPHFTKQRDMAIATMITLHNADSLTEGNMRSLIATLAALDALERDLAHRVRLGQKDLEASQRG